MEPITQGAQTAQTQAELGHTAGTAIASSIASTVGPVVLVSGLAAVLLVGFGLYYLAKRPSAQP